MKKYLWMITGIIFLSIFGCSANNSIVETQTNILPATLAATSTPKELETLTLTPAPNATQRSFIVKQFLLQNDNCDNPCVWGIVPEETTLKEAQKIFADLGNPLVKTTQLNNSDFYQTSFGPKQGLLDGLSFQIILTVDDQNIKNIRAGLNLMNFKDVASHSQWIAYSPEVILKKYGHPTRVDFFLYHPSEPNFPSDSVWYDMTMYYEPLNLIFEYSSNPLNPLPKKGEEYLLCPISDQFVGVNIWLGKDPVYPPVQGAPLEKISLLSLDKFYDALTVNSDCFEINSRAFVP